MAITGSGTSADPYKPTTWSEFLQCTTTDGKYTELPEGGGTFDMTDYYTDGEVHNIPLRGFINGNGWIIKNAKVTNTSGSAGYYGFIVTGRNGDGGGKISNLDFTDFTVDSNGVASTGSGSYATASAALIACAERMGYFIEYCRFWGAIKTTQIYTVSSEIAAIIDKTDYNQTINTCSFNISIVGTGLITYGINWQAAIKYCNIRVQSNDWEFYGSFNNCYIEGTVPSVASFSHAYDGYFRDTVINANVGSDGFRIDYGQPSNIVVNSDKYSGTLLTGMTGLTTAQLKSKTDLDAVGFTISTDPTATTEWHIDPNRNGGFPYIPVMLDIPENPPQPQGGAFEDAAYLKKVTIPQSCLSFGETAFAGTQLESVTINPSAAYSNTTFPEGCEVQFYGGGGDYVQLLDGQGRAVVDGRGKRVYVKS